jgi:hypothetical protein
MINASHLGKPVRYSTFSGRGTVESIRFDSNDRPELVEITDSSGEEFWTLALDVFPI